MKIIKSQTHYRNDAGTNATIIQQDNNYIVYTDLSAEEKRYSSLKEAQHDLITSGFYPINKKDN